MSTLNSPFPDKAKPSMQLSQNEWIGDSKSDSHGGQQDELMLNKSSNCSLVGKELWRILDQRSLCLGCIFCFSKNLSMPIDKKTKSAVPNVKRLVGTFNIDVSWLRTCPKPIPIRDRLSSG